MEGEAGENSSTGLRKVVAIRFNLVVTHCSVRFLSLLVSVTALPSSCRIAASMW